MLKTTGSLSSLSFLGSLQELEEFAGEDEVIKYSVAVEAERSSYINSWHSVREYGEST